MAEQAAAAKAADDEMARKAWMDKRIAHSEQAAAAKAAEEAAAAKAAEEAAAKAAEEAAAAKAAEEAAAEEQAAIPLEWQGVVTALVNMGFSSSLAEEVTMSAEGNFDQALESLFLMCRRPPLHPL